MLRQINVQNNFYPYTYYLSTYRANSDFALTYMYIIYLVEVTSSVNYKIIKIDFLIFYYN